jgi:hypothetical protein
MSAKILTDEDVALAIRGLRAAAEATKRQAEMTIDTIVEGINGALALHVSVRPRRFRCSLVEVTVEQVEVPVVRR